MANTSESVQNTTQNILTMEEYIKKNDNTFEQLNVQLQTALLLPIPINSEINKNIGNINLFVWMLNIKTMVQLMDKGLSKKQKIDLYHAASLIETGIGDSQAMNAFLALEYLKSADLSKKENIPYKVKFYKPGAKKESHECLILNMPDFDVSKGRPSNGHHLVVLDAFLPKDNEHSLSVGPLNNIVKSIGQHLKLSSEVQLQFNCDLFGGDSIEELKDLQAHLDERLLEARRYFRKTFNSFLAKLSFNNMSIEQCFGTRDAMVLNGQFNMPGFTSKLIEINIPHAIFFLKKLFLSENNQNAKIFIARLLQKLFKEASKADLQELARYKSVVDETLFQKEFLLYQELLKKEMGNEQFEPVVRRLLDNNATPEYFCPAFNVGKMLGQPNHSQAMLLLLEGSVRSRKNNS